MSIDDKINEALGISTTKPSTKQVVKKEDKGVDASRRRKGKASPPPPPPIIPPQQGRRGDRRK